jgi:hypothetical protein
VSSRSLPPINSGQEIIAETICEHAFRFFVKTFRRQNKFRKTFCHCPETDGEIRRGAAVNADFYFAFRVSVKTKTLLKSLAEPDFPNVRKFSNPRRVFRKPSIAACLPEQLLCKLRRLFARTNHFFGAFFIKRSVRAASQIRFAQSDFFEHSAAIRREFPRPNASRKPARFLFRKIRIVPPRRSLKPEIA